MNSKKLFIFCILSSAKIISAMEGDDINVRAKVGLKPFRTFEQTSQENDASIIWPFDAKSLLILIGEAHHAAATSDIDRRPFFELLQRIKDGKIALDKSSATILPTAREADRGKSARTVTFCSTKDIHHRLFPYFSWTGQSIATETHGEMFPLFLKGIRRFAYLVGEPKEIGDADGKAPQDKFPRISWTWRLEDFSDEHEVSQISFEQRRAAVAQLVNATHEWQLLRTL